MSRQFTVKVYSRNNGTVDVQTLPATGEPGTDITRYFCVDDKVFKYEILDEFNNIVDTQDISGLTPGTTSSLGVGAAAQWETLTVCCHPNWLLTENKLEIICDQNNNPIILS